MRQQGAAVGDRTAQDPMSLDLTPTTDITRIGPANVSSERALLAQRIVLRVAEVVKFAVSLLVPRRVRGEDKRRSVRPPPHELGSQALLRLAVPWSSPFKERPETGNVLFQLAKHDVRAVLAELVIDRKVLALTVL